MKLSVHSIFRSFQRSFRKGLPVLLATAMLLVAGSATTAQGWVAVRRGYGGGYGGVYRGGYGYRGYGYGGVAVVRRGLPFGYRADLPYGYRSAFYGGYNCYYAGGAYYRPEFYQGSTVYVVVP